MTVPPIISGLGKATNFKFGRYIQRAHTNKSRLKIQEKLERGRIQGVPNFFEQPLLSQERIKLRTSNFVCTFLVSIGTKALYKFLEKQPRTLETFQGTHILGASCGRLCDSKAFLFCHTPKKWGYGTPAPLQKVRSTRTPINYAYGSHSHIDTHLDLMLCVGTTSSKSLRLRCFKWDRDKIWQ